MWPILLNMTREECRQTLRRLELEAYSKMVTVFRVQGTLEDNRKKLLEELRAVLHISQDRHCAEARRVSNDQLLATVAQELLGPNTALPWIREGRRRIPLLPRGIPQTSFTEKADLANKSTQEENKEFSKRMEEKLEQESSMEKTANVEGQTAKDDFSSNESMEIEMYPPVAMEDQTMKLWDTELITRKRKLPEESALPEEFPPPPKTVRNIPVNPNQKHLNLSQIYSKLSQPVISKPLSQSKHSYNQVSKVSTSKSSQGHGSRSAPRKPRAQKTPKNTQTSKSQARKSQEMPLSPGKHYNPAAMQLDYAGPPNTFQASYAQSVLGGKPKTESVDDVKPTKTMTPGAQTETPSAAPLTPLAPLEFPAESPRAPDVTPPQPAKQPTLKPGQVILKSRGDVLSEKKSDRNALHQGDVKILQKPVEGIKVLSNRQIVVAPSPAKKVLGATQKYVGKARHHQSYRVAPEGSAECSRHDGEEDSRVETGREQKHVEFAPRGDVGGQHLHEGTHADERAQPREAHRDLHSQGHPRDRSESVRESFGVKSEVGPENAGGARQVPHETGQRAGTADPAAAFQGAPHGHEAASRQLPVGLPGRQVLDRDGAVRQAADGQLAALHGENNRNGANKNGQPRRHSAREGAHPGHRSQNNQSDSEAVQRQGKRHRGAEGDPHRQGAQLRQERKRHVEDHHGQERDAAPAGVQDGARGGGQVHRERDRAGAQQRAERAAHHAVGDPGQPRARAHHGRHARAVRQPAGLARRAARRRQGRARLALRQGGRARQGLLRRHGLGDGARDRLAEGQGRRRQAQLAAPGPGHVERQRGRVHGRRPKEQGRALRPGAPADPHQRRERRSVRRLERDVPSDAHAAQPAAGRRLLQQRLVVRAAGPPRPPAPRRQAGPGGVRRAHQGEGEALREGGRGQVAAAADRRVQHGDNALGHQPGLVRVSRREHHGGGRRVRGGGAEGAGVAPRRRAGRPAAAAARRRLRRLARRQRRHPAQQIARGDVYLQCVRRKFL